LFGLARRDSSGGGLLDKFEASILRHATGQPLGEAEGIATVNATDRLGLLVADKNDPDRNLLAIGVAARSRAFKENATPRRTRKADYRKAVGCAETVGKTCGAW